MVQSTVVLSSGIPQYLLKLPIVFCRHLNDIFFCLGLLEFLLLLQFNVRLPQRPRRPAPEGGPLTLPTPFGPAPWADRTLRPLGCTSTRVFPRTAAVMPPAVPLLSHGSGGTWLGDSP